MARLPSVHRADPQHVEVGTARAAKTWVASSRRRDVLGKEIGRVLRQMRLARGLTLRQAASVSEGRFPATSIAGYERGERAITLERFVLLTSVYGARPERLVAELMRSIEHRAAVAVDRRRLVGLQGPQGDVLTTFVEHVASARRGSSYVLSLRTNDIEVLATYCGCSTDAFVEGVSGALVGPIGGSDLAAGTR
jgi:transcriptional regulator with XRE-family HTH domain